MSDRRGVSRRGFMQNASIGAGLSAIAAVGSISAAGPAPKAKRLPREVWVATVSQNRLEADSVEEMTRRVLSRMEEVLPFEPDIICLPEVFPFANLSKGRPPLAEVAEEPIGPHSRPFAEFAEKHGCHVACPIYTVADGKYYNSAVFIDRHGRCLGEYHKMHPTVGEMENGIMPGTPKPPVFKTDIGVLGAQICFDIEWYDGWRYLSDAGAELVFWPSAFAGGMMVNTHAWQNKYCVVSSTRKGTTKICDIDGRAVACTGQYDNWVCAPVNLEKVLLHSWPYCRRFAEIRAKYGRRVSIRTLHEEEFTIIESLSPEVRVADILEEFELRTHKQHIQRADAMQQQYLKKMG